MANNKLSEDFYQIVEKLNQVGTSNAATGKAIGDSLIKINVDVSDAIKGLKAVQREARKATAALKEFEAKKIKFPKTSLLQIELESIESVPRVFYKGEEIAKKIHIGFDWSTQTDISVPSPMIDIEYADTSSSRPNIKRITHNPLGGDSDV